MLLAFFMCFAIFAKTDFRRRLTFVQTTPANNVPSADTQKQHGTDLEGRCAWHCSVPDSRFGKEIEKLMNEGKLVKINVKYEELVDESCLNQTDARNSTAKATMWIVRAPDDKKTLGMFGDFHELFPQFVSEIIQSTEIFGERREITVICVNMLSADSASNWSEPRFSLHNNISLFLVRQFAKNHNDTPLLRYTLTETENNTNIYVGFASSESPFNVNFAEWQAIIIKVISILMIIGFALYSGAFLSWFKVTEVTEQKDSTGMANEEQSDHAATEDSLPAERPDASEHNSRRHALQPHGPVALEHNDGDGGCPLETIVTIDGAIEMDELQFPIQCTTIIEETNDTEQPAAGATRVPPESPDPTQITNDDTREVCGTDTNNTDQPTAGADTNITEQPTAGADLPEEADAIHDTNENTREVCVTDTNNTDQPTVRANLLEGPDSMIDTGEETRKVCDTDTNNTEQPTAGAIRVPPELPDPTQGTNDEDTREDCDTDTNDTTQTADGAIRVLSESLDAVHDTNEETREDRDTATNSTEQSTAGANLPEGRDAIQDTNEETREVCDTDTNNTDQPTAGANLPEGADAIQDSDEETRNGCDNDINSTEQSTAGANLPEGADAIQDSDEETRNGCDNDINSTEQSTAGANLPEGAVAIHDSDEETRNGCDNDINSTEQSTAGANLPEGPDAIQDTNENTREVCGTEQTSNGERLMILDGSCPYSFCIFFANLCLSKKGTWCCRITEFFLRVLLPFVPFPIIVDFLLLLLTTFSPIFSYYLPSPYLTHAVGNFIFYNPFMLMCSICYYIRAFCFLATKPAEWMPCLVCNCCLGQTCQREAELPKYIEHHLRMLYKLWAFKFTPCRPVLRIMKVLFLPVIGMVLTSPALCVSYRGVWLTPKLFTNCLLRGFFRILEFFVIFFAVLGTVFVSIFTAVGMVTFLAGLIITLERYPEKTFLSLVSLTFVFHSLWVHYNTFTKQINHPLSTIFTCYKKQYDKLTQSPKLINYNKDNKMRIPKDLVEDVWEKLTPVRERFLKLVGWILFILALNFIVVSFTFGTAYTERTTFFVLAIPKFFEFCSPVNPAENNGDPDAIYEEKVDTIVQGYVTRILNPNQSDEGVTS